MQQRILGRTGLSVSALGFGSAPVGFLLTEQRQVTGVLNRLLDRGVNVIDTAAAYDGSEEAIGKAVSHRRADYVLISKCGQSFAGLPGEAWSAELITATVDRALRRLQTDHIDVMLLHSCGLNVLRNGAALEALVKAREAGKISFAGYSGDNEEAAFAATFPDIAVIEASINVCDQANLASLLPLTQKQNIGIVAKRPIANGAWRLPEQQSGCTGSMRGPTMSALRQWVCEPETWAYPMATGPGLLCFSLCRSRGFTPRWLEPLIPRTHSGGRRKHGGHCRRHTDDPRRVSACRKTKR